MTNQDKSNDGVSAGMPAPPGMEIRKVGPLEIPMLVPAEEPTGSEETAALSADADTGPVAEEESATNGASDQDSPQRAAEGGLEAVAQTGEEYLDQVERAIDKEDCTFCAGVLQKLRTMPVEDQVQGVRELRTLKEEIERDPSEENLNETLDQFEVLDDIEEFL